MRNTILLFFFTSLSYILFSQNIEGRVLEKISEIKQIPIIGANVYWENTTIGTVTDENGFYSIQEPPTDPANLLVSFIGYEVSATEIIDDKYIFYLSPNIELKEVDVKGEKKSSNISTISSLNTETLTNEELEKAACCNLSESFETNATVDISYSDAISGAKKIKMLGLDGIYTQITQENMPLIRGLSSSFGLSFTPGPYIESIQIIKGTGSVINGFESFTGQINLEYFKPNSPEHLYYNFFGTAKGKLENNLRLTKRNGKWKSNLFVHQSYHDIEIDENNDDFLDMPHLNQINLLNRWKYESNDIGAQFFIRGIYENREGGTIENAPINYDVEIENKLIEFSSKTGIRMPEKEGKSIGLQTSFRLHEMDAQYGDKLFEGVQKSMYLNLVGQTYFNKETDNLFYGASFYADQFSNSLDKLNLSTADIIPLWYSANLFEENRQDIIPGIFSEYTFYWDNIITLTTGFRADYYNITENLYGIPRLNIKYNPTESTALRLSGGRSLRVSNFLADNISLLASNREISISANILPEIAWNYGFNFTHCFYLNEREGTLNVDFYRTIFENHVVVNLEDERILSFSNLTDFGQNISFSNAIQFDFSYSLSDRFDLKLAYKLNDAKTTYPDYNMWDYTELKEIPLLPKQRGLFNLTFSNLKENWLFDATLNYIGKSRIPYHQEISKEYSDPFSLINCQITNKINKFDFYLGVENLLEYKQENPIIGYNNSESDLFDASLIWAPTMGRRVYFGIRYKLSD